MTAQLDPWELFAEDDGPKHNHLASGVYANCPACDTVLDFDLGTACNIDDTDCEACQ